MTSQTPGYFGGISGQPLPADLERQVPLAAVSIELRLENMGVVDHDHVARFQHVSRAELLEFHFSTLNEVQIEMIILHLGDIASTSRHAMGRGGHERELAATAAPMLDDPGKAALFRWLMWGQMRKGITQGRAIVVKSSTLLDGRRIPNRALHGSQPAQLRHIVPHSCAERKARAQSAKDLPVGAGILLLERCWSRHVCGRKGLAAGRRL